MELFYKLLNLFGFGILFLFAIRRAYEEEGVWGWSQSNKSVIFIIIIAFMISAILIFTRTKIILDLFCKKKFDHK